MNQQEWLDWRRGGIGSSDAAVILGISPWKTQYKLWCEKVFGEEQRENSAMKRGKEQEPLAFAAFEKELNVILQSQLPLTHPHHEWIRATLDGLSLDEKIAVEIKCPGLETHQLASVYKTVPAHYYAQIQHQLAILGLFSMYYYSYYQGEGISIMVHRNDEYIESYLKKARKFWDYVINFEAPPFSDKDWINMEKDENWQAISTRYKEVNNQIKELEEEESFLRGQFILFSEGNSATGCGIKLTKIIEKGRVDYTAIPEIKDVNLDQFRKNTTTKWRISLG